MTMKNLKCVIVGDGAVGEFNISLHLTSDDNMTLNNPRHLPGMTGRQAVEKRTSFALFWLLYR